MSQIYYALLATSSVLIMGGMAAFVLPDFDKLSPGDSLGGNFPSSLAYVGTVDRKTYLAEKITRTWNETEAYWDQLGLRLASITSPAQLNLLNSSYGNHFMGWFWTSGRDVMDLRQFAWSYDGAPLNSTYLQLDDHRVSYRTCVIYQSHSGQSTLETEACEKDSGYTLCESVPA